MKPVIFKTVPANPVVGSIESIDSTLQVVAKNVVELIIVGIDSLQKFPSSDWARHVVFENETRVKICR